MRLRNMMIQAIVDMYLNSQWYGDYILGYGEYTPTRHTEILQSLEQLSDTLLLSVYTKLVSGFKLIVCHVDKDGNYADVLISGAYGGMDNEGNIHT